MYRNLSRSSYLGPSIRVLAGTYRATLVLTALSFLAAGCDSSLSSRGMDNAYYLNPYKDLSTLGRVALVQLDNASGYPTISGDVTQALFVALQKRQVFGVTIVPHDDPEWQGLQENLDSLQALKKLLAMREILKCNGLLVGTITEYQPYPHMAIGLRLKLLDLTDGQLLWGFEQVWDTADKGVEKRVRHYFDRELRSGASALHEELVVVSSLQYCKFVAYEVAATLDRDEP